MKAQRTRWIPSTTTKTHEAPDIPAVVYWYGEKSAAGYGGRRTKPDFHYQFRSPERRAEYTEEYFKGLRALADWKREEKHKRDEFAHDLKVGDIFYESWGYEQTNITWYQVTRIVSDKSVEIRPIGRHIESGEGLSSMAGYSTPIPDHFTGPPVIKRVQPGNYLSSKYGCTSLWDGKPKYCSWYH